MLELFHNKRFETNENVNIRIAYNKQTDKQKNKQKNQKSVKQNA